MISSYDLTQNESRIKFANIQKTLYLIYRIENEGKKVLHTKKGNNNYMN